jgi:hypothetical protein
MDLAKGSPVRVRRDDLLAVDLRMKDFVDDPEDAPEASEDRPAKCSQD